MTNMNKNILPLLVSSTSADDLGVDAFGRRKTSSAGNRSDTEFLYDKQPLLYDDISTGAGSATHNANPRDITVAVGDVGAGDMGGIRKHYWVPYTPGNGQTIDITGVLDLAAIGGGHCELFLRTSVTGSPVTTTYLQSAWVGDKVPTADWTKSQIFAMDFQSLKVGRVRYALVRNGLPVPIHEVYNDNIRNSGYWQYASLPPYWKVYNSGGNTISEMGYGDDANGIGIRYVFNGTQATATLKAICETVKSEDGDKLFDMPGFPFVTPVLAAKTVSTTLIPILSLRVAATFNSIANRSLIIPTGFSAYTDNPIDLVVVYRPTLTGPSWVAVNTTYSGVEYDITASAITGGIQIAHEVIGAGKNTIALSGNALGRTVMALGSGAADILSLAAIRYGATDAAVKPVFSWKEIR